MTPLPPLWWRIDELDIAGPIRVENGVGRGLVKQSGGIPLTVLPSRWAWATVEEGQAFLARVHAALDAACGCAP